MQSDAKDVTTYIQEAPAERQEYLAKLRDLCLEVLTGYEGVREYGMPGYKKDVEQQTSDRRLRSVVCCHLRSVID